MDKDDAIAWLLDLLGEAESYISRVADVEGPGQANAKALKARIDEAFSTIDCN